MGARGIGTAPARGARSTFLGVEPRASGVSRRYACRGGSKVAGGALTRPDAVAKAGQAEDFTGRTFPRSENAVLRPQKGIRSIARPSRSSFVRRPRSPPREWWMVVFTKSRWRFWVRNWSYKIQIICESLLIIYLYTVLFCRMFRLALRHENGSMIVFRFWVRILG